MGATGSAQGSCSISLLKQEQRIARFQCCCCCRDIELNYPRANPVLLILTETSTYRCCWLDVNFAREQNFSSICMPLNSMLARSSSSIIYFSKLAQKANGNRGGIGVAIDVIKWSRPETDSLIMYNGTVFQRTSAEEVEKVDHFPTVETKKPP